MTYGIVFSGSPCIYNDVCYCRLYMDMANHQHIPSYLLRGLNPMLYEDYIYHDTPWNFITWDLKLTWDHVMISWRALLIIFVHPGCIELVTCG